MKRVGIYFFVLIIISCGKSKEPKVPSIKKEKNIVHATNSIEKIAETNEKWYVNLVENYIAHSKKKLIIYDREKKDINWVLDNIEANDSANYYIFNIGHDEMDEGNTNARFTSDGWIYIDSLTQKTYEYDLPNDQLILWKDN